MSIYIIHCIKSVILKGYWIIIFRLDLDPTTFWKPDPSPTTFSKPGLDPDLTLFWKPDPDPTNKPGSGSDQNTWIRNHKVFKMQILDPCMSHCLSFVANQKLGRILYVREALYNFHIIPKEIWTRLLGNTVWVKGGIVENEF